MKESAKCGGGGVDEDAAHDEDGGGGGGGDDGDGDDDDGDYIVYQKQFVLCMFMYSREEGSSKG